MRTISEQELKNILEKHGKWLKSEEGGERADLRYADLSSADLSSADLSYANLRSADLRYADGFKFKPIQVVNVKYFITILDDYVLWGCKNMTFDEVKSFKFSDCKTNWDEDEFKLNKKIITEMIKYYRKKTR